MNDILANPLVQAAALMLVAASIYLGRRTFGQLGKSDTAVHRSKVKTMKPVNVKKMGWAVLDVLFTPGSQQPSRLFADLLPELQAMQQPQPAQKPTSSVAVAPVDGAATLRLPGGAQVAQKPREAVQAVDPAKVTEQAVMALPEKADWPLSAARAENLPFMHDGKRWHGLSLRASQHYVVCGASGSGKGNLLQLIGLSVLALGPDVAQVWFLDAKQGLDYDFATRIAHARLYADVDGADGLLAEGFDVAIVEMERRNSLMYGKARNIAEYATKTGEKLPTIVLVVDEVADMEEYHDQLATLARMGRAAGIILLVCTQYPTADVLPSQIQANALNRICLKLSSRKQTAVALALAGGETSTYEPAAIVPSGVAIFRHDGGKEHLGRVPEVTDEHRAAVIDQLVDYWPREVSNVSSVVPGGSWEPVPMKGAKMAGSELGNQYGTSTEPVPGTDGIDAEVIKALHSAGWSRNDIAAKMKGRREARLARIREALGVEMEVAA